MDEINRLSRQGHKLGLIFSKGPLIVIMEGASEWMK
jgi:hypothetical protein